MLMRWQGVFAGLCLLVVWCVPAAAAARPLVAVFDARADGLEFDAPALARLTERLAGAVAASGDYRVVKRSQLQELLAGQQQTSHKQCHDHGCRARMARQLGASKYLAAELTKHDGRCVVAATLHDLATASVDATARAHGECTPAALTSSVDATASELRGDRPGIPLITPPRSAARPRRRPPRSRSAAAALAKARAILDRVRAKLARARGQQATRAHGHEAARTDLGSAGAPPQIRSRSMIRPGKGSWWTSAAMGAAVYTGGYQGSAFNLTLDFGYHISGRPSGLGLGLELEIVPGEFATAVEFAAKLVWDFQLSNRHGFYISPGFAMGYLNVADRGGLTVQFWGELKLALGGSGMVFFRPIGFDIWNLPSTSDTTGYYGGSYDNSSTDVLYKLLFGGGFTF